jgi:hypothetical protein
MDDPTHDQPELAQGITVEEAHQIMQQHLGCAGSPCGMRRAAVDTLVEAGHYTLAS